MASKPVSTLEDMFAAFSKFGDSKADGKSITLTNTDKWMKQAQVFGKKLTTTDTGISFNKFKSRQLDVKKFKEFLADLAKSKGIEVNEIIEKLINCGMPGTSGTTKAVKAGGVDRLTDTTKYTGTHKERFDDKGKGKGIEGRADLSKDDGYVEGYKNKDTYDNKK